MTLSCQFSLMEPRVFLYAIVFDKKKSSLNNHHHHHHQHRHPSQKIGTATIDMCQQIVRIFVDVIDHANCRWQFSATRRRRHRCRHRHRRWSATDCGHVATNDAASAAISIGIIAIALGSMLHLALCSMPNATGRTESRSEEQLQLPHYILISSFA